MFEFRPELVDDDDEEADDTKYSEDDDTEVSNGVRKKYIYIFIF